MTSSATSTEATARPPLQLASRLTVPLLLVLGIPVVLAVYRWHITASGVFLWFAWASLVITTKLLWSAFWAVASDSEDDALSQVEIDDSLRGDLLREKKALLRSIKDVEFDRDMGKMSDVEAGQILRVYRARAIEIIKQLESTELDDDNLSPDEAIERELVARLAGAGAATEKERTEAEAIAYARQMAQIEELEGRDVHLYRIIGGAFLAGVGLFITLVTYSAASKGGGMYILWYGPIVTGLAVAVRGVIGLAQVKERAAPETKTDKEST